MKTIVSLMLAAAAAVLAAPEPGVSRLPGPLADLVLMEDHPKGSPVKFSHARHIDPEVMGADVACVDCHHELDDEPDWVPASCASCHPHVYELEGHGEGTPHEELWGTGLPDL